jgi:Fe(3+) dicitrate transport protein
VAKEPRAEPADPAAQTAAPPEGGKDALEVTVAGARLRETSGSAHVVRSKQLERFEYDDPHQVLQSVPGVYVRGEDGFGLRPNIGMRGAISDRSKKITLMEDGILFGPAPYSAPAAYYFPLITRMTSVRVVKGPSAIRFGPHTIAGALDLITAPIPDGRKGQIDIALGQYLSRKVHARAGLGDDALGVLIEGVHVGNAGFKVLDGGGDTGFSRNEWMAKARYDLGNLGEAWHEIEAKAGYSDETSNETYLGLTDADFERSPLRRYGSSRLDKMEWHRTQLVLTHRLRRGADLELVTTAYRHDLDRIWRKVNGFRGASLADILASPEDPRNAVFYGVLTGSIPPSTSEETLLIGPNDRRFVSQGLQTTLTWSPVTGPVRHRFELGARLHYDSVSRLHTQNGFLVQGDALVPDGDPVETTADNDASSSVLAMHAVDAATLGPVTLTAGARIEAIHGELNDALTGVRHQIIQQVLLPGAGVFVELPRELGLFGGVYQGFSPIPPGQSENVRPEKSINYEGGLRWSPRGFRAEVIGFFNDYTNLSNICTFSTGCAEGDIDQQFDGGAAIVYGLEGYVESELEVTKGIRLPGRVAYTLTEARFSKSFTSSDPIFGEVEEGDRVPYIPAHQIAASAGVELKRFAANIAGTYVSPMREIAGQGTAEPGAATDGYFLLDASVSYKAWSGLTAYVVGRNLLNMTYVASRRPFGARPGAPIWIQAGAKLDF